MFCTTRSFKPSTASLFIFVTFICLNFFINEKKTINLCIRKSLNWDQDISIHRTVQGKKPRNTGNIARMQVICHAPGRTFAGDPRGADAGGIFRLVSLLWETEGAGAGAPDIFTLLHNSEQLVFKKPILSLSRSYVTKVFRTTIPAKK